MNVTGRVRGRQDGPVITHGLWEERSSGHVVVSPSQTNNNNKNDDEEDDGNATTDGEDGVAAPEIISLHDQKTPGWDMGGRYVLVAVVMKLSFSFYSK